MKIGPILLFLFIVQTAIFVFNGVLSPVESGAYNSPPIIYNSTSVGANVTTNYFYNYYWNPVGATSSPIFAYLATIIVAIAALSLLPLFTFKNDLVILFPVFLILVLPAGLLPVMSLYTFLNSNVGMFACDAAATCYISQLIGALIGGAIGLMYVFAALEWWSGRQFN